jgi:hypothetical protein
MHFSSSRPAEGDYYQSEEFRLTVDFDREKVFLERTLVRYGPGDDFYILQDTGLSFGAFTTDIEARLLVTDWLGEQILTEILNAINTATE